jgi:hypothetical protein
MKELVSVLTLLMAAAGALAASEVKEERRLPVAQNAKSSPRSGVTGLEKAVRRPDGAQVVRGTLAGNGTIEDRGTRVIEGKVAPGNSPGCVADQGNVIFEGSSWLEIELGGATACSGYDQYTVNLSLTLNGPTLKVLLINGFVPSAGQRFDVLNWGTLSGTFATLDLPALPGGLVWDTSSLYATGELVVAAPGDVPLPAWALALLAGGLSLPIFRKQHGRS